MNRSYPLYALVGREGEDDVGAVFVGFWASDWGGVGASGGDILATVKAG